MRVVSYMSYTTPPQVAPFYLYPHTGAPFFFLALTFSLLQQHPLYHQNDVLLCGLPRHKTSLPGGPHSLCTDRQALPTQAVSTCLDADILPSAPTEQCFVTLEPPSRLESAVLLQDQRHVVHCFLLITFMNLGILLLLGSSIIPATTSSRECHTNTPDRCKWCFLT
jgi:hypothetical protein